MIKSMNRLNTVGPVKVGSLKSQLHLRPSYDELLKETLVGDENRPSIENVIDRKATRYRLNQYGSQFDNKDALDIQKKQELNRREEVMKEASSDGGSVRAKLDDTLKQQQSFINERLAEANKQKEELAEKMRLWREQHDEMASAVSKQSIPEGVEIHSMVSADEMPELEPLEEGEEEDEHENDPVVELEALKKGKDDDDDAQTTITNAEIMEMQEQANEMELQNVENEDVDDERIFKKYLSGIKWMWPVYLAKNPRSLMDSIISKLHQFNVINAVKYDEFKELLDEYNNTTGVDRNAVKVKLQKYYEDNVYNKYFVHKATQQ